MKILVIGLGSMGKRRARLLKGLNAGHEIFGVDNSTDRCSEAESLGITAFQSLPEAVKAEDFSCAFVCTAPLTHAIIIDQLLDAGLSVFTELNLVSDGYKGLVEKAEEKGLTLFLSSTMLYRSETNYIAKELEQFRQRGKKANYIYHIGQYLPDWHPWEHYKNFFVGDSRTGGVREILAIDLPWLVSAFGPVDSISVQSSKISDLEISYDDSVFISLRHKDGTMGFLAADVVSPKAVRNFEVFGEGLHIFWKGSPTSLYKYNMETKEKEAIKAYDKPVQDPRYSDNIVENAYVDEILNFFDVLSGKGEARWSFKQDFEIIALMEQIGCLGGSGCPGDEETEKNNETIIEAFKKADDMSSLETIDGSMVGFADKAFSEED